MSARDSYIILTSVHLVLGTQSAPEQTESYRMGKYTVFAINNWRSRCLGIQSLADIPDVPHLCLCIW